MKHTIGDGMSDEKKKEEKKEEEEENIYTRDVALAYRVQQERREKWVNNSSNQPLLGKKKLGVSALRKA